MTKQSDTKCHSERSEESQLEIATGLALATTFWVGLQNLSRTCIKIASATPRNDGRGTCVRNGTFYKRVKTTFLLHFAFLIFSFAFSSSSFAEDIRESRLDKGLKNNEPYSYVLIKKAHADPSKAKSLLAEAVRYSPDLPPAYFEMAKTSFSPSAKGMFESLDYAIKGFKAYKGNFWWLISITGLFTASLMLSFVIALALVLAVRFFIDTPLLSHDIKENRMKILIVILLIPVSFLGSLFFLTGFLVLLGLYFRGMNKAVVYVSVLILLLSPFCLRFINMFLSAPSSDLRAIVAVNESRDNKYAASVLKNKDDYISLFSYGLALKREGRYEEAIAAYKKLLASHPDSRAYVNLGNSYAGATDMAAAKEAYKKSIELKPLASAYYNLSHVSRETLDFAKGEEYFNEAIKLNRESVSQFAAAASRNPNRFVIDETLPMSTMWEYAGNSSRGLIKISPLNSASSVIVSIALLALFFIMDSAFKERAYRCQRCGVILCGKCGKEKLWGEMCSLCYKSLIKLDALDSRIRVAKQLEVQELQKKKRRVIGILSFVPPGIAHIYWGRILSGILFLWLFLFLLLLILLKPLFSTGLSLFSHSWITIPASVIMVSLYLIFNIDARRRLK
ncbi:MAG: tetratricopeptide repeat protein [Thermodesulfovibrionales bacterium]|nr:tetratricopeptide repeat protein [Thermodesulfovibrionales bacterium]